MKSKHIAAAILATGFIGLVILTGCANDPLDRAFRSRVQSDKVTLSGNFDPVTKNASGQIVNEFTFRDPSK